MAPMADDRRLMGIDSPPSRRRSGREVPWPDRRAGSEPPATCRIVPCRVVSAVANVRWSHEERNRYAGLTTNQALPKPIPARRLRSAAASICCCSSAYPISRARSQSRLICRGTPWDNTLIVSIAPIREDGLRGSRFLESIIDVGHGAVQIHRAQQALDGQSFLQVRMSIQDRQQFGLPNKQQASEDWSRRSRNSAVIAASRSV